MQLLLIDDALGRWLVSAMDEEGWDAAAASSARQAVAVAGQLLPDVVVADVDRFGADTVRRVLHAAGVARRPVGSILMAGPRGGRDKGSRLIPDDRVTAPVCPEDLFRKIRAILRRSGLLAQQSATVTVADLLVNEDMVTLRRGETEIALSVTEFRLLNLLMRRAGEPVSKQTIADRVWGPGRLPDEHSVETAVSTLRRKIDRPGPGVLHFVRGAGYCLRLSRGDEPGSWASPQPALSAARHAARPVSSAAAWSVPS